MKGRKFTIGLGLLIILVAVSLIALSMKEKKENKIIVSAEEVHKVISAGNYFFDPEQLEKDLNSNETNFIIIDLRSPDQFLADHIEGAINIPFQRILDSENADYFKDEKIKIVYTNDESKSAEVWVLLEQLGYEEVYVLKGGFNYWVDKIKKKDLLGSTTKNTEKPRFDFKKELSPEE